MLNTLLKSFLILLTIIYGIAFVYSLNSVQTIEKNATEFIKHQIHKETQERIDTIGAKYQDNKLVQLSKKLYEKENSQLSLYKEALSSKLHEKVAAVVAKMQNFDCECREKYSNFIKGLISSQVSRLSEATKNLQEFMQYKYMYIVQNLIQDFRIFAGSNVLVVMILLILMFRKPQANLQISLLAGLMAVSTIITSYLYIFEQNWFYTILYSDFMGYLYLGYLGIIFVLLWDIIFNKARITTEIFNFIANAIGSSVSALSC